jgi:hypothetical protein
MDATTPGLGLDQPLETRQTLRAKRKAGLRPSQASRIRLVTFDHLDFRTQATQKAVALIAALEAEKGGTENITEGVRQLCTRAAVLGALCENFEVLWLAGTPIDIPDYLATVATQRRVLQALGLQREAPRDVTPSLSGYLSERDPGPDKQEREVTP